MENIAPNPSERRGFHKSYLILGILALLLILFLLGWLPRLSNTRKIDALAEQSSIPRVTVLKIQPNTKSIDLVLPTSAQAWHITPLWSRVNGYLLRFLVDIGDSVKKGDLLAEIDTPETDQDLGRAKAELENSLAELDIARITKDRWNRLLSKNNEAVSKQEVDQFNANFKSAEAVVEANEKNVSRLTYQQQFKFIYAPFDGVITQRNVDIGSLIYGNLNGAPEELFQIAQTGIVRFFVEVPQNYFRQIHDGINVSVTVQEFPDKAFSGKVTRYAKALDPISRTLTTQIDVDNSEGLMYPGLFGKAKFVMTPDTINFIIPTTALLIRNGAPQVAVVDKDNTVHLKKVRIGLDYGKTMEITGGLAENDQVIMIPPSFIQDGSKVEIVQPEKPKDQKVSLNSHPLNLDYVKVCKI